MSDAIECTIRSWASPVCPACGLELPKGPAVVCNGSLYHVSCYASLEEDTQPVPVETVDHLRELSRRP